MKEFLKYTAATIVGLVFFGVVMVAFGTMSIVGIMASDQAKTQVEDNSVMVLNLDGEIVDQGQDDIVGRFTGGGSKALGLNEVISAIKKAKANDKIKGIYIEAGNLSCGYATLQELRNALADFRNSGKWIIAYGDSYAQDAYYVASVANKVYINPKGMLDWHGLASQPMFYKDVLAKFGVKYQVVKVGTYKSATEVYTEEKMSDANRQQVSAFIGGTWKNVCQAVSKSRGVSVDSLNSWADRYMAFEDPEVLKRAKLVDGLIYADQVKGVVKKMLKLDDDDDVAQISVSDMQNVKGESASGDEIAVYYASGTIVQDNSVSTLASGSNIVATTVCKDLEHLMNDDNVKAVVIRINSGGGDAYASEQIWHQVSELKAKKPVVVSMGDYAASGGYYMSASASWIVAQPNTLTGSIGIFATIPDMSGLITQKLGVKFDEVKTNRNSTFGNTMARPLNAEETRFLQNYVNRGYDLFRQRVADGRHLSIDEVERIAQGHVWLGSDALKIKLVDELGGLDVAIAKAAKLAKMDKWQVSEYPEAPSWMDQIVAKTSNNNYLDEQLRANLAEFYEPFMLLKNMNHREMLQARVPFCINMK
jgi:protease IV